MVEDSSVLSNGEKPFKRLNFFPGFFTKADDWNDGEAYHLRKRQHHNMSLHSPGIMAGIGEDLAVVPTDKSTFVDGYAELTIRPGAALDPQGREIYLHKATQLGVDLPDHLPATLYITISFAQKASDLVENLEYEDYSGYTRWMEYAVLRVATEEPTDAESAVLLASVLLQEGVTELRMAADPGSPLPNEIDRHQVSWAGAVDRARDEKLSHLGRDLLALEDRQVGRHMLINQGLFTPGILPGVPHRLAVVAAGGMEVILRPGAALDARGNLLEVATEYRFLVTPQATIEADNLQTIKGIGPVYAERLNQAGIYTFAQFIQALGGSEIPDHEAIRPEHITDIEERWRSLLGLADAQWRVHRDQRAGGTYTPAEMLQQARELSAEPGYAPTLRVLLPVFIVIGRSEGSRNDGVLVRATNLLPDNEEWIELARITFRPGATEIKNATDIDRPAANEIDRSFVAWAGCRAAPALGLTARDDLTSLLQETRRAFRDLALIFNIPSADDVRSGALSAEMLAGNRTLRPAELGTILNTIAVVEQDVAHELRDNHPEIHRRDEFLRYDESVNQLRLALADSAEDGRLLRQQRAVAEAAEQLAALRIQRPSAAGKVAEIVATSGDTVTVRLDASDSEAFHGESVMKYIWTKRS